MRRYAALFWFGLALVLTSLSFGSVSAQINKDVASFSVDGQTHVLRYPDNFTSQAATIQSAFAAIIPVYEKMWNATSSGGSASSMDFRVFVDVDVPNSGSNPDSSNVGIQPVALPIPSSPWNGKTEATKTNVCMVQIFNNNNIYATPQRLQFEIALDLAQCYINHYGAVPANPPDWWFKGLSY